VDTTDPFTVAVEGYAGDEGWVIDAILHDYGQSHPGEVPDQCQFWDPEKYEFDDLDFLKDVDAQLIEQGVPHLVMFLEVERLLDAGLDILTPETILTGVLRGLGIENAATPTVAGLPLALLRRALQALFG